MSIRSSVLVASVLGVLLTTTAGDAWADVEAGIAAYKDGNFDTAVAEFQQHAADPKASYYLGLMHERGVGGLLENYATALKFVETAGQSGHIEAQLKAASMYEAGLGAPQSSRKAAEWNLRAAEQGDVRGQLRIGLAHRDGTGVPRDKYRASLWLGRAAEQGNLDAIEALRGLRDQGLISNREMVARLAGVPPEGAELTDRGRRVRDQLDFMLDPIRFLFGDSKKPVSARDLEERWLIVEREADVLALLPDASVLTDEGDIIEVGTIRLIVVPQPDEILEYRVAVPSRLIVRDGKGTAIGTIVHDDFEISGKWSESLRTSPDVDIRWTEIRASIEEGGLNIDAGALKGRFVLSQLEPAVWRQASSILVKNLRIGTAVEDDVFKLGQITFKSEVDGAHPDAYKRLVGTYVPGYRGPQPSDKAPSVDPQAEDDGLKNQIAEVLGRRVEGSLEFTDVFANPGNGSPPLEVASGSLLVGLSSLDRELSELEFTLGYDGFRTRDPVDRAGSTGQGVGPQTGATSDDSNRANGKDPDTLVMANDIPPRFGFDVVIERLPLRRIAVSVLTGFLGSALGGARTNENPTYRTPDGQFNLMPMMFQSTTKIMEAGTRAVLNRLEVSGGEYGFVGNGVVAADPAAVHQVSGGFDVTVTNLRKALQSKGLQSMLPGNQAMVGILEEIGQSDGPANALNYRVDITQLGTVEINGRDLVDLMNEAVAGAR